MIDKCNFEEIANRQAWALFHFLPGNQGVSKEEGKDLSFAEKMVCHPDSYVARDMLAECITEKRRPYSLHRMGITLHVYADTWAHQGFVGTKDNVNIIRLVADSEEDKLESEALRVWPLGHGMALKYPDHPWRNWQYKDLNDNDIPYSNTAKFIIAADAMVQFMRRYLAKDVDGSSQAEGLTDKQKKLLAEKFTDWTSSNDVERRQAWIDAIERGEFLFSGETVQYSADGADSWKAVALQTTEGWDSLLTEYTYSEAFLTCDWKLFHDAAQAHSFYLLHELLPSYGICLA